MENNVVEFPIWKNEMTPEVLQKFWNEWRMNHEKNRFIVKGLGQVYMDVKNDDLPTVLYDDGFACLALPRDEDQVNAMGYLTSNYTWLQNKQEGGYDYYKYGVEFANFIHESVHLLLSDKLNFEKESVAYRQATGCTFDNGSVEQKEAVDEEVIVIGLQCYINGVCPQTVKGFQYFLAKGAMDNAEKYLLKHGFTVQELMEDFFVALTDSNRGFRV